MLRALALLCLVSYSLASLWTLASWWGRGRRRADWDLLVASAALGAFAAFFYLMVS